jgi:integration host factor subunit beta
MSAPRNHTTTKKELVNRIADTTGHTKVVVKEILQTFLEEIIQELSEGNRLEFREFGVFEVKERRARRAQNPRTLERVEVPAKRVVKFKVGRMMRERVCDEPAPSHPAEAKVERRPAETRREEERPRPVQRPQPPTSNSPF